MSRKHALDIFHAALKAADPVQAVLAHVKCDGPVGRKVLRVDRRRYRLADFDRIHVIGSGKASAKMAQALERLLGKRVTGGWINVPDGTKAKLKRIHLHASGHPVPDERGVEGARRIAEIARESGPRDLLLCVISGGASALMPLPVAGMTLEGKKAITRQLLASGATIHEMNTVRKHLSAIKGGHLAALGAPATVVALILSDVIGDDLSVIGSGPTVLDSTTVDDAAAVLKRFGIPVPQLTETPKTQVNAQNVIVGSNRQSIDASAKKAKALGYRTIVLSTTIDGETREIARMHAALARELMARGGTRACFLSGGETTVTIRGKGLGGRNQEFVLAAAIALESTPQVTIFSGGTDGIDGPTDAAGAIADASTLRRAGVLRLDPAQFLADNDSYHFFEKAGGLVKTGPTGTNVADVRILLV
ncbi:MAG TPA: glycerate kinase [Bryobacteraceae bacterium]|nr:glycerate kinase [Bryobacteraceae bacterium]